VSSRVLQFRPETSLPLIQEVMERSGQNLLACYQCRRCAAGCPVGEETGVTPDRLIRMIIFGEREEALNNILVWKCVACYTCGVRCPNNIQTARITETLKQMAKRDHIEPLLPKVAAFHDAFLKSTSHFGRVNEIEFMGLYSMHEVRNEIKQGGGWKAVADKIKTKAKLGISMIKKKRMHIRLEKTRKLHEIKRLFNKARDKAGN